MKIKNKDILCIGEVLWDRLPDKSVPGGAPMNVALHLSQFGYNVLISSCIGNDTAGRELIQFIRNAGVNTDLIQTNHELPTSEVPVYLDKDNNPTFDILEPVAWDKLELTNTLIEAARNVGMIVYGTLASRNEITRKTILSVLEYDNIKLIDINLRPPYNKQEIVEQLVRHAGIVKMNEEELLTIAGWYNLKQSDLIELMKWFSVTYKLDLICVTRGKDGALVLDRGKIFKHKGFKVKPIDTVGSGDAFLAGFVFSLFEGKTSKEALNFACALGAYVATKKGATPEYHSDEIELILDQLKDE
jgi:fructokinase